MAVPYRLRGLEDQLKKDLEETTIPLSRLGKKYRVTKQAISLFVHREGIARPKREHTEHCRICQRLIRIAKRPHSDFISSRTIREQLKVGKLSFTYHMGILRKKGLISQKFGRLQSRRLEKAYKMYFEERLPARVIASRVGLTQFASTIKYHKASGWDVPDGLLKKPESRFH